MFPIVGTYGEVWGVAQHRGCLRGMLSLHTEMLVSPGFSTVLRCWFLYCSNFRLKLPDILSFQVEVLTKLSTPFFSVGRHSFTEDLAFRITNHRFLLTIVLCRLHEIWFVSSCHSRQRISCVRAPLRSHSNLV